jgi:phosphoribosylformimino-5-aminoimidazole carboxamide ribotide isomerase
VELIAAIDLLDGRAVRLTQGDYAREAMALDDPVAVAERFVSAGVGRLHLVDLEGARAGSPQQLPLVRSIVEAARHRNPDVRLELGGGLRTLSDVAAAFETGITDAVLGTAAVERPAFAAECAARWPGCIRVSLDLRDERPALDGWLRESLSEPLELARQLVEGGAAGLIVTDARRDGTLSGPNLDLLRRFRAAFPSVRLVAAGGVGSLDDIRNLVAAGIDGAIVGLALLSGDVDVREALSV